MSKALLVYIPQNDDKNQIILESGSLFYIDSITGKRKTEKLFNLYTFIIDGVRYFLNINFRNKNGIYNKEAVNHQTKKAIQQIRSGKYSKIIHQKSLI